MEEQFRYPFLQPVSPDQSLIQCSQDKCSCIKFVNLVTMGLLSSIVVRCDNFDTYTDLTRDRYSNLEERLDESAEIPRGSLIIKSFYRLHKMLVNKTVGRSPIVGTNSETDTSCVGGFDLPNCIIYNLPISR